MIRVYIEALDPKKPTPLSVDHYHYLAHVMRLKAGDSFLAFNQLQGEFLAVFQPKNKKEGHLLLQKQTRLPEQPRPPVTLYIAPIRKEKMELVLQKATEIGVEIIQPILTKHTCHRPLSKERADIIIKEAVEQSERLTLPNWLPPISLEELLIKRSTNIPLFYLSERGETQHISLPAPPISFLIGPEGGFSKEEITLLGQQKNAQAINLGAFILRAETAAIAMLATYRFHKLFYTA